MPKINLEKDIKYKVYRTRKDILTYKELLDSAITYMEVFYCIFRSAPNPTLLIKAYDPESQKSFSFEINTKYQRQLTSFVIRKYAQLAKSNPFLKDIDNIYEVMLIVKGLKSGMQTIYGNSAVPWQYSIINYPHHRV